MSRRVLRKTKIVATIGPASDEPETLQAMIKAGMNVARLNFSHGTRDEHHRRIDRIRAAASSLGTAVAIMLDTRGVEIRTGRVAHGGVSLSTGSDFTLYAKECEGNADGVTISDPTLGHAVTSGTRVLIDDGLLELAVDRVEDDDILCRVVRGGRLGDRKGVSVPDVRLPHAELSERDRDDILFAVENDIVYIAASFVQSAEDVHAIRRLLEEHDANVPIIAKIESKAAVENLDEIIKASDGTMVARGDLGVQIPVQDVPIVQKTIIHATVSAGKPVITATQMLDSMQRSPVPTRAEVSDVANAIFDGTSAVMLSGETANGAYPVEAVRTMAALALRAEGSLDQFGHLQKTYTEPAHRVTDAVSQAAISTAHQLNAAAIITLTETGFTSRSISKFRPSCPILAITGSPDVVSRLAMNWGVTGIFFEGDRGSDDEMIAMAIRRGIERGYIEAGDRVVATHGVDRESGSTSMIRVLTA